jgi:pilus assembly protein FimV
MAQKKARKGCVRHVLLFTLLSAMADGAWAIGLGQVKVYSGLGQPFHAEIPIYQDRQTLAPDQFVARIADADTHRRRGLSVPAGFQGIKTAVISTPSGRLSLKLTSHSPINEPIVNFLVQLHWPNGESIKEVAALLDPPQLAPNRAIANKEPDQERKPLPTAVAPRETPEQRTDWVKGSKYGPVPPMETLMQVARNVRGDAPISLESVVQRIFERNPKAFVNRDIHRLQAGAWLTIPDLQAAPRSAAPISREKKAVSAKAKPKTKPIPWANETRYGPIKPGESLWEIGQRLHGGTPEQIMDWMEAVAARNKDAFIGRDTDRLMAGAVLRVPGVAPTPEKEETKTAETTEAPAPTPEKKPEDAPKTAETPPPSSEPTEAPVTDKPSLQVTGLAQDQENAVRIKDLEEQLAQERDLAKERDLRNQLLVERISALENTIQELREKAITPVTAPAPASVPAPEPKPEPAPAPAAPEPVPTPTPAVVPATPPIPKPVEATPPQEKTEAIDFLLENPWLGGLLAVVLGGSILWFVRKRSTQTASDESSSHWAYASSSAESEETPRSAAVTTTSPFPEPDAETGFFEPKTSEPPLASEQTFIIESAQKQNSSHVSREAAAYMAYGDYDRAQTNIEAAIAQDPNNDEYKVMLLAIYSASGQHDKAGVLSTQLLNQHPPVSDEIRKQIEDIQSSSVRNQRLNQ